MDEAGKTEKQNTPAMLQAQKEAAVREVVERIDSLIHTENIIIKSKEQDRDSGGLFGKFHRLVTTSDPFAIDISRGKNVIESAEHVRTFLTEAMGQADPAKSAELINQARRVLGMREITNDFNDTGKGPQSLGMNKVDFDSQHFVVEEKAIEASGDAAETGLDIVGVVATMGASAAVKAGVKVALEQGLKQAGKAAAKEAVRAAVEHGIEAGVEQVAEHAGKAAVKEMTKHVAKHVAEKTAEAVAVEGSKVSARAKVAGEEVEVSDV
ncbi:MAG: hypothetical protein WCL11_28640, partial [Verrucomicrobiota bacterium]